MTFAHSVFVYGPFCLKNSLRPMQFDPLFLPANFTNLSVGNAALYYISVEELEIQWLYFKTFFAGSFTIQSRFPRR